MKYGTIAFLNFLTLLCLFYFFIGLRLHWVIYLVLCLFPFLPCSVVLFIESFMPHAEHLYRLGHFFLSACLVVCIWWNMSMNLIHVHHLQLSLWSGHRTCSMCTASLLIQALPLCLELLLPSSRFLSLFNHSCAFSYVSGLGLSSSSYQSMWSFVNHFLLIC